MKKALKRVKIIFILLLSLMVTLLVSFYSWKKDVIKKLPKNSLVIDTDHGQIEYTLTGDSDKYMLMIHGSPGSVHVGESKPFVDNGISVLAISRPGYHKTPLSSGKTPKEQAALYKSLLDELKIDSVFVNAMSAGGISGIQFALDYPERTAGLILKGVISGKIDFSKIYELIEEKEVFASIFSTEFETWLKIKIKLYISPVNEEMKRGVNAYIEKSMFPSELTNYGFENDLNQIGNLEDFPLEKITAPTIIFHGDNDFNVPLYQSQNAAKRIPNNTFFKLKGKTHYVFVSPYKHIINNKIIQFIHSH